MLEIILIVALSKKIAAMMRAKGRSPTGYVVLFILLWIGGEILGAVFGALILAAQDRLDDGNELAIYLFAVVGAAFGAILGFVIPSSLPTLFDDDDYEEDEEDRARQRRRRRQDDYDDDQDVPDLRQRRPPSSGDDAIEDRSRRPS